MAFGVIVLLTVLVLGLASFQQALSLSDQHDVQVVAHRAGAIRAPENSLSALRLAIEEGADAAEIDVQLSRDGTIFVIHDRDLMRLASTPLEVSKATDAELLAVPIGLKHKPPFPKSDWRRWRSFRCVAKSYSIEYRTEVLRLE